MLYDIKYLMRSCRTLRGGLQELADDLGVRRVGPQHQAGSDARLTGLAFFRMKDVRAALVPLYPLLLTPPRARVLLLTPPGGCSNFSMA